MLETKPLPSAVDDAAEVMALFHQGAKKAENHALRNLAPLLLSVSTLLALAAFLTN